MKPVKGEGETGSTWKGSTKQRRRWRLRTVLYPDIFICRVKSGDLFLKGAIYVPIFNRWACVPASLTQPQLSRNSFSMQLKLTQMEEVELKLGGASVTFGASSEYPIC